MATLPQAGKYFRRPIKNIHRRHKDLLQCPQKRATCLKVHIMTPRKPNSALRKVARVLVAKSYGRVSAYIQGMGHNLQKHSVVLIRGGDTQDLPGLQYKIVRGKGDLQPLSNRRKGRSKFGAAQVTTQKCRPYRRIQFA